MESIMNQNYINLPRKLTQQLLQHALLSPTVEVCGLIGADYAGKPSTCYPISNCAPNPAQRFELDAQQQIAAIKSIRDKHESLFAIYHSHPTAPATPSRLDLEQANYPKALHLIISLNTKGILELRAFQISENNAFELNINLIEA
jgi:proteasome lid subunit RPN8/RPN11